MIKYLYNYNQNKEYKSSKVMNEFKRGAEWRQWDLHLHTKSSYDYRYKGEDSDTLLCDVLKSEGVCAVAITDHFKIDKTRIENLRSIAPEIVFFPAVELRTDKGASNLHLILIFDNEIDLSDLESDFNSILGRQKRKGTKDEDYYWDFNDILDFAKEHNAIVTIHAGNKTNGIDEQITNSLEVKEAIKEEIASKIHIFEMGKIENFEQYRKNVFPTIGRKAMVMCSDNHNPNEYTRKAKLWIKADVSFKGLEYAIKDPENRIFIGDIPTKNKIVSDNQTKYIDTVKIKKISAGTKEIWFDNNELQINQDLVAIIGNKGNGKSALADIIAFNSNHKENFSFLKEDRFRTKRSKLAENFESEVSWKNGTIERKRLDEEINTKNPTVKYIPQSYLEKVCNEIIDGKKSDFNIELGKVIFSHIPEADRLGYDSIEKLIENTTITRKSEKNKIIEDIKLINKKIAENYKKISLDYKKNIQEKLQQKKLELESLIKQQPKEVLKPENSEEIKEEQEKLLTAIAILEAEKKKLTMENDELMQKYATIKIAIQNIHYILDETNGIKTDLQSYKCKIEKILTDSNFDIKMSDILKYEISVELINKKLQSLSKEQEEISARLNKEQKESIINKIEEIDRKIKEITENLNAPNKLYQKYEIDLKDWNDKISKIKGNSSKIDTITYYEEELGKIDNEYARLIVSLEQDRNEKIELIYKEIEKEIEILKKYYIAVQKFIDENKEIINDIKLEFDVVIIENSFREKFLNFISLNKKGTFNRNESKVNDLLAEASFDTFDGIKKFIDSVMNSLKYNITLQEISEMEILSQLRDVDKLNELLDFVYSLDYLFVQYELKLGGKTLNELSPRRKRLTIIDFLSINRQRKLSINNRPT